jgi:hypothetical protein
VTRHAEEVQWLKDEDEHLKAEFESQRSGWSDWEKYLSKGYEVIEDLLEGKTSSFPDQLLAIIGSRLLISLFFRVEFFPDHTGAISQVIEERRER